MGETRGPGRLAAVAVLLISVLLGLPISTTALDPALDVNQYAHTSWKAREGFLAGPVHAIAQTPDGYLWLGTEFGLLRFDGVRSISWQPPDGSQLPSITVMSLLAARDGSLWIGTLKGLAAWKKGRLVHYRELAGQAIMSLLEDRDGTIWAGAYGVPTGRLCAIQTDGIQCHGEDGSLGDGVINLYQDTKGNVWSGVRTGLWKWKPGVPTFYSLPGEPDGIRGLGEDDDGTLLVGMRGGIRRFVDGRIETYPLPLNTPEFRAEKLLRDRDGGLWIATTDHGLVHVHQRRVDVFARIDGLTAEYARNIFEDREGNIWVATLNGLDRFRGLAVVTLSTSQGLSNAIVPSVLADAYGTVWLGTYGGLDRWENGRVIAFGQYGGKLKGLPPNSLFQDHSGRIWVSTPAELGYLEDERFVSTKAAVGGFVNGMSEDGAGNLWIASQLHGLFRLVHGSVEQQIPWANLGDEGPATALAADPVQGGLWLGFSAGGVAYLTDGQVHSSYSARDGLGSGRVNSLRVDADGTLWAATEGGLSRIKDGRVTTLTSKNGLPCEVVHAVVQDDDHSSWLNMPCGLVRISTHELDAWSAAVDRDKGANWTVQVTVFDSSEGARSYALPDSYSPQAAKASDGRLWFASLDGASVVDPRHLTSNTLPPPVHIEQLTADGQRYIAANGLRLPSRVRDLTIDYTALSFVIPEKVHFRYKLEGQDRDWREVVNDRRVQYSNLPPKNYRFRLMACNNNGVWNEADAFVDFSIAPAYYQTNWFRALCVAAFLALFWALYQYRVHQLQRQFNVGLEARVNERTRIARELHDTLLQSFHGVLFLFHALSNELSEGSVKQKLDRAIDLGSQAIKEGRDAVQGLRSTTVVTNDLAAAVQGLGEGLASDESIQNPPLFNVTVQGTSRDLHPILRDEVYRIAEEALRNAFRHSQARRVEVEIRYDPRRLRLRIRDDGKGIEARVLENEGRAGHWGLRGMRERALEIGGTLDVLSEVNSGTEVELSISAGTAYLKSG